MSPPLLRPASAADADGIAAVHVRSWQHAYSELLPADALAALSVPRRAAGWRTIIEAGAYLQVALVEDRVAGFVNAGPCRDDDREADESELYAIYADPAAWSTGVGHALHEHCIGTLASSGFRNARLWVLDGNRRAITFYERHGWQRDGATRQVPFDGHTLAELRMIRAILSKSG